MEIFLVKTNYLVKEYMSDKSTEFTEYNLVHANDIKEAELKATKFYNDKTEDYDTSYFVRWSEASETIK